VVVKYLGVSLLCSLSRSSDWSEDFAGKISMVLAEGVVLGDIIGKRLAGCDVLTDRCS
jgi:hypothetical protein